ncbi:hypothetical protein D6817_03270 [Candidatus Pacearchaeota archaeon]|nr:MAG: hypothetical protein D6817_03270 [Candidatus Pacearchaeota archaeon]
MTLINERNVILFPNPVDEERMNEILLGIAKEFDFEAEYSFVRDYGIRRRDGELKLVLSRVSVSGMFLHHMTRGMSSAMPFDFSSFVLRSNRDWTKMSGIDFGIVPGHDVRDYPEVNLRVYDKVREMYGVPMDKIPRELF